MIRRSPRSTLFRYTTHFPISVRPRHGAPHGSGPGGDLRREMLRGAAARAGAGGPRAHDVEDRPLPHQAEDEREQGAACRRDERPHVLRRRLVRIRRRAVRRGPVAALRGGGGGTPVAAARRSSGHGRHPGAPCRLRRRPEIRDRAPCGQAFRRQVPRLHPRRRAYHVRARVGTAACVEYAAGAGAPLRSGHRRGARLLPDRSRELARRPEPRRVKPVVRRRALLVGVGLLAPLVVGRRGRALETAERAWGASLPGGTAYLTARDFGRLVSGMLLIGAVAWATANLLFVYRSIGSMQLSRRLGDLEIVEAVPQPLLLAGTIPCGLVFGFLPPLGTAGWGVPAALASRPPTFGVTDPVLQRDLGYYLGRLPWTERLRELALAAVCAATVVVALLYVGIGSLRFRRWLPYANAHARAHLGVLLALLALTLTWGALLDPAESVAGLHGALTRRALDARLAAAPIVAGVGVAATLVSLVWGLREKPALLFTVWGALVVASLLGFAVIPGSLASAGPRGRNTADPDTALVAERRRLEGLAFGVATLVERAPPGFPGPEAAATAIPIWDAQRVLATAASRRSLVRPQSAPTAAGLS